MSIRKWWYFNTGSGNGMVPPGNKPLSEPMLTHTSVANFKFFDFTEFVTGLFICLDIPFQENLQCGFMVWLYHCYGMSCFQPPIQGLYSLSVRTSYRQISWSLEVARLEVIMIVLLWIWQASRQRCCRCGCQISERLAKIKPQSRGFKTSRDLAVRRPSA